MIAPSDITGSFPELAPATNTQLTLAISRAYHRMSPNVWDIWLDEGALYLAAHMVAVMLPGFRPITTGERLGPASKTYANNVPAGWETFYQTKYGREYVELLLALPGARFTVATAALTDPDTGFTA